MGGDFYRYDFRAVRVPWLECVNGLPLRILPAGLTTFARALCNRDEYRVPAFGGLDVGVSNSSSTSTVQSHARLSDLASELPQGDRGAIGGGRSDKRA